MYFTVNEPAGRPVSTGCQLRPASTVLRIPIPDTPA